MKFKIFGEDLHYIMSVAGAGCAKDHIRPILKAINCKVDIENNRLIATSLNGYLMHRVIVPITIIEVSDVPFNIAIEKSVDKKFDYTIDVTATTITYDTGMRAVKVPLIEGEFIDADNIYPKTEPVFTISVDPKLLMTTLKAYRAETCLKLEFYGKASPFKFSTKHGGSGIVMPVHNNGF